MVYQHLMNGVSFMVPFIVVGGLLIAIALTLGGHTTPKGLVIPKIHFGNLLKILIVYRLNSWFPSLLVISR